MAKIVYLKSIEWRRNQRRRKSVHVQVHNMCSMGNPDNFPMEHPIHIESHQIHHSSILPDMHTHFHSTLGVGNLLFLANQVL